jgi:superfamily II DNA helicase RecQ
MVRAMSRPPDPLEPLRQWRAAIARAGGVVESAVCSDATLRGLLEEPPMTATDIAARLGLSPAAAERMAPKLLSVLGARASA